LETAVSNASLTAPGGTATTGNISLDNTGTLALTELNAGLIASVTNSGGVLTLGGPGTSVRGNTVEIRNSLSIASGGAPAVVATNGARLEATGGTIGGSPMSTATPFAVRVLNGYLELTSGVQVGGVYGNIDARNAGGIEPTKVSPPDSNWLIDGVLTNANALISQAGVDVSALTGPVGQGAFEAVESQMIETVGDPSEAIEEELQELPQQEQVPDEEREEEKLKKRGASR
jgi:hypothetical protein